MPFGLWQRALSVVMTIYHFFLDHANPLGLGKVGSLDAAVSSDYSFRQVIQLP
jgi:hypothetical protein